LEDKNRELAHEQLWMTATAYLILTLTPIFMPRS